MTDNKKNDSTTKVYSWREGRRRPVSFRCNEKLWKAFKRQTKAEGSSVCHILEAIIATYLGVLQNKVYSSNTIEIKELHVTREVKRARRYAPVGPRVVGLEDRPVGQRGYPGYEEFRRLMEEWKRE